MRKDRNNRGIGALIMNNKILLIDHEILIAKTEEELLEKHGYIVVRVSNGKQAVEMIGKDPGIRLVLMAINTDERTAENKAAQYILEEQEIPLAFFVSHPEHDAIKKPEKITSSEFIEESSCETALIATIKTAFRLHRAYMKIKKQKEYYKTALRLALTQQEQTEEELLEKKAELAHYHWFE